MLSVMDIVSKLCITAMFVIIDLQTIFLEKTFMSYKHTKAHTPGVNGWVVTATKCIISDSKEILPYQKLHIFLIPTTMQNFSSGASVAPASKACMSVTLLPTAEN